MADAAYAPDFWSQVAAAYKDNPMVVFELYNEPVVIHDIHDVTGATTCRPATIPAGANPDSVWHDGGQVFSEDGPYTATGMQVLRDRVRATGAQNLVLVGGIGPAICNESGAYDISVARRNPVVDGTGALAYSSHPYWGGPNPDCGAGPTGIPTDLDTVVAPTAAIYPVVFSEFGSECSLQGGAQQFNQEIIDWAVGHHLGWINYRFNRAWSPGPGDFGLYQCDATTPGGCTANNKTYAYYEPRDRGLPAWNQLGATPNPLN